MIAFNIFIILYLVENSTKKLIYYKNRLILTNVMVSFCKKKRNEAKKLRFSLNLFSVCGGFHFFNVLRNGLYTVLTVLGAHFHYSRAAYNSVGIFCHFCRLRGG